MKKLKIAINGFGRIGRQVLKIALGRPDIEVIAINDLTDNQTLAHLFKYDSVYGIYPTDVVANDNSVKIDNCEIKSFAEKDAANLPWRELGVDLVIESTGHYRTTELASAHLQAGAKRVIISAPAKDDKTKTLVIGVNDDNLNKDDLIVSNASCTTNCTAPIMSILEQAFGVEKTLMTTIHANTASQNILDGPARDPRMARACGINVIPTTTGASKATALVLPSVEGNIEAMSVRVPIPVVSLCDFAIVLRKKTTLDEVKKLFKKIANQPFYQGIVDVTEEELVSSDFIGNPASAVVDLNLTKLVDGDLLKIVAWYDNEWAYSNRLVELAADMGKKIYD